MLSHKMMRIGIIVSLGVVFIILTLLGLPPFAVPKPVSVGEEPMARPDQIDVYIYTPMTEYSWDEVPTVYCQIKNLTRHKLRIDQHLWNGSCRGPDQIWKICWAANTNSSLILSGSGGMQIELYKHEDEPCHKLRYLPPGGSQMRLPCSPKLLKLNPGQYTLTLTVMGKSATCEFTFRTW